MGAMRRRRLAWLLSMALMAIGGFLAHLLAYSLAAPHEARHAEMLAASGHGYQPHWPVCVAICATIAVIGLASATVERARGHTPVRLPLWVFGAVPPAGFVIQEHVERFVHTGAFPYAAAAEATFVIGIVLQIPFALLAFVLARLLLAFAEVLGAKLGGLPPLRLAPAALGSAPPAATTLVRPPVLALGHGQRAPPALLLP